MRPPAAGQGERTNESCVPSERERGVCASERSPRVLGPAGAMALSRRVGRTAVVAHDPAIVNDAAFPWRARRAADAARESSDAAHGLLRDQCGCGTMNKARWSFGGKSQMKL